MHSIIFKEIKLFNSEDLVQLFTSVGWVTRSAAYPERLQKAMLNSDFVTSAWDGDKLVGLVSAIDDSMHAFCVYPLVDPEYQGKGIGKELFTRFDNHYKDFMKILITEEARDFYSSKFMYEEDSVGMVRNGLT